MGCPVSVPIADARSPGNEERCTRLPEHPNDKTSGEAGVQTHRSKLPFIRQLFHLFQAKKHLTLARQRRLQLLISSVAADPTQRALICSLTGDDAQHMVDYLDLILNGVGPFTTEWRCALSLLGKLAKSSRLYPRCYVFDGVKLDTQIVDGGGFSDICRGTYNRQSICLKILRVFRRQDIDLILTTHLKELVLWAHLSHPNMLPFYGVYLLDKRICLVSPWIQNGNLCEYLENQPRSPRIPLLLDVISGLEYLHQSGVVHGDIKAENVLVSDDGRALIADFGLSFITSTSIGSMTLPSNGTPYWKAPELLTGTALMPPTQQSDIWSFGCLCYEVLARKPPFYQHDETGWLWALLNRNEVPLGPLPGYGGEVVDARMWAIMKRCWDYAPQNRPTCETIRELITDLRVDDDRSPAPTRPWDAGAFQKTMKARPRVKIEYEHIEALLHRIRRETDV